MLRQMQVTKGNARTTGFREIAKRELWGLVLKKAKSCLLGEGFESPFPSRDNAR